MKGILILETADTGFYGGIGAGGMLFLKENIFLNLEYEWAYLSNSWYSDGFLNTAQLGIGFKF
jgi:opacity protein-like surface antigen